MTRSGVHDPRPVWRHGGMAARIVVSLSGLTADPAGLGRATALVDDLDARGVTVSHLFRPRPRTGTVDPHVLRWLRERRAAGDEIVLHGFDHTPDPIGAWQASPVRLGRRAEFAMLPRHEAALRITAARRAARAARLDTDLFVPPRWLASAGTVEALRRAEFVTCADENTVRFLGAAERTDVVVRARVLGFRDLRGAEQWRARRLVAEAAGVARRGGLVRIALRVKDLYEPGRVTAALAAVDAASARGARSAGYAPAAAAA